MPSSTPERFPWRLFWFLLVITILAALSVLPLAKDIAGAAISKLEVPDISLPLLIIAGVIQNLGLLALMIGLGLKLSRTLGLRTPVFESWLMGAPRPDLMRRLVAGLVAGAAVGIILVFCLVALVPRFPNLPFVIAARVPVWKRFLMCFYGGIYEEVLTRLFLLSLIAWIANRSWRKPADRLPSGVFWFANIFAAVLFGLGHLPSTSLFMPITPLVVVAALLLNGIAGIVFGYLYRWLGLEAAMIAHFTADFVIYVAGASLLLQ
jgi:hypothetical protein